MGQLSRPLKRTLVSLLTREHNELANLHCHAAPFYLCVWWLLWKTPHLPY
jgi:hypothetical protein